MKNSNNIKNIAHKKRNKKLLLLFVVFGITIIFGVTTTYAWFVGIGSVKVNNFTVNITSENYLELSLDGYTWSENLTITENTIKGHNAGGSAYNNNTNSWVGEEGLIPVSSSGDNTNGVLDIYSKSSLVGTNGGYNIVANKLNNTSSEETHYVAFDIFVKNKSGDYYNSEYNLQDDENIFLTNDSTVTGTASGATAYGIQNSARVAFVQVGRINLDDLTSGTTPNIKCTTPTSGETYTPLCNAEGNTYNTVIWEPNELAHDTKLVTYYNMVCKNRLTSISYGDDTCEDITDGYVTTYTIKNNIIASDNVNIYDGLNTFNNTIKLSYFDSDNKLNNTKTFTDTMKATEGHYTLFKLAPHSVTKIRVYVYLEGQDVDNYDLITKDQDIKVTFGFTKERKNTDVLLDVESRTIDLTINGDPIRIIEPSAYNGSYTWGDWINDTIPFYNLCNDYICKCNSSNSFYLANERTVGDVKYYGRIFDSNNNSIDNDTVLKSGAYHSESTSATDFRGVDYASFCSTTGDYNVLIYIDEVRYFAGYSSKTWYNALELGKGDDLTQNILCGDYYCVNQLDKRVISLSSYNNGYADIDFLLDSNGHRVELDDYMIKNEHYTTYHPSN